MSGSVRGSGCKSPGLLGAGSNLRPYRDRTGARAPGVERRRSLAWRCSPEQVDSDTERRPHAAAESTKGGGKPDLRNGNAGSKLNRSGIREGPI